MSIIEVKFRGDNGPEYKGKERRRDRSKRSICDRVTEEIEAEVKRALGGGCGPTTFAYRKLPPSKEHETGTDDNRCREDILWECRNDIALQVAKKEVRIKGLSEEKLRELQSRGDDCY